MFSLFYLKKLGYMKFISYICMLNINNKNKLQMKNIIRWLPFIGLLHAVIYYDVRYLRNPLFVLYHIIGMILLGSYLSILIMSI